MLDWCRTSLAVQTGVRVAFSNIDLELQKIVPLEEIPIDLKQVCCAVTATCETVVLKK